MVHFFTSRDYAFIAFISVSSLIESASSFIHPFGRTIISHPSSVTTASNNVNILLGDRRQGSIPIFVQSKGSSSRSVVVENDNLNLNDDDMPEEQQENQLLLQLREFQQFKQRQQQQRPQLLVEPNTEQSTTRNGVYETISNGDRDGMISAPIILDDASITKGLVAGGENENVVSSDDDSSLLWKGVVALLCAVWASNFACAKIVLAQPGVDASLYAVARFSLAAVSLLPGAINAARKGMISWDTARGAFVCGSWVAFGYLGQTVGLMTTTPSRACVICSLNCIFVAIVAELSRVNSTQDRGYKTNFDLKKLIPALIAVAGVAIIELKGAAGNPTIGDLICFSQPIGFGMGYLQLEELMKKEPDAALPVSGIKLAVVAMAALALFEVSPHVAADASTAAVVEGAAQSLWKLPDFTPILSSPVALGAICYTGIVTTSLALWVESIAFQRVQATDASIILTTEPLFAAAISSVLVGEQFGASDAIGAFFIVGACIYAVKMGESATEVCDEVTKECVVVGDKLLNS
jgi:drug/metabolite transporter (DMT)-like permease